jgi:hypothetical protein
VREFRPHFDNAPVYGHGPSLEEFTEQTPLTVGSPQQVIDKTLTFREHFGDYLRQLFLMDHAGLPLTTVLEQRTTAGSDIDALLASRLVMEQVYVGNASVDAAGDRGWLLGHFKPVDDARHSDEVEIKWGVHPPGDQRAQWVTGEKRTALLLLISGRFRVELPGHSVLLAKQGDYVVWGQGVDHSWCAEEESVVLTVRWPSVPGYAVPDV